MSRDMGTYWEMMEILGNMGGYLWIGDMVYAFSVVQIHPSRGTISGIGLRVGIFHGKVKLPKSWVFVSQK